MTARTAAAALLPAGLSDILPPEAEFEAAIAERLLAVFAGYGYEQVKPPIVEFEETLLSGTGAAMKALTFRLMDPASQRMMGVRADITPQIARIARGRLRHTPRPLRLSYSGEVLCVSASRLRPEREFLQVGAEIVGAASARADAEVVVMAAEALAAAGVGRLSIDLTQPTLVRALCESLGLDGEAAAALRAALDRKDTAAVAAVGGEAARLAGALLEATGPHERALAVLGALALAPEAAASRDRLAEVATLVAEAAPELALTVDPVEYRGFEYQTGVSFTVFGLGVRGELGRGGRYETGDGEPATGFTLFMDSVLRALPPPRRRARIFAPAGLAPALLRRHREAVEVVVAGLDPVADSAAEARRMGCTAVLGEAGLVDLES